MSEVLSVTRMSYTAGKLFFLTEEESIFGELTISSEGSNLFGQVKYLGELFPQMLGTPAHNRYMVSWQNLIYIFIDNGRRIVEYNINTSKYSEIGDEFIRDIRVDLDGGVAGIILWKDKIYLFPRFDQRVIIIDVISKKLRFFETKIKSKIMWVCGRGNMAYVLSWDVQNIYYINLDLEMVLKYPSGIDVANLNKSKSIFQVHNMCCDDTAIYLYDAKAIYRFDILEKRNTLLYQSKDCDNGVRIIVAENSIIVPPWNGNAIYIIDKKTGQIQDKRCVPNDLLNIQLPERNKMGVPCEGERHYFLPLIYSDRVLRIDKVSLDFAWIKLRFNSDSFKENIKIIVRKNEVMQENPFIGLIEYLKFL